MKRTHLTTVSALLLMVIGAWSLGMSARNATITQMPSDPFNGCTIIGEAPTGPEPDVTIWHRIWDCDGSHVVEEFYADECGYVIEGMEMVPGACSTFEELYARIDEIRDARSGVRDWGIK